VASNVPTLASSTLSQNVLPSSQVGSFKNQAIGQQTAGLGTGAAQSSLSPSQIALQSAAQATPAKNTAVSLQQRQAGVLGHNDQLTALAQAASAKKRQAAGGSAAGTGGGGDQQGSLSAAYTPNGSLSAARNKILGAADSLVGKTPYVWGGTTAKGLDCAGLVMWAYQQVGMSVDRDRQSKNIPGVRTSVKNLRPGDLVVFNGGSHIAIYAGNGNVIEAAHPGTNVRVHSIWSPNVYGIALRLPGE
jgi:cell wall-associated NlpC family hydrolase